MQVIQTATLPQEARDYLRRINRRPIVPDQRGGDDWQAFRGEDGDWEYERVPARRVGRPVTASGKAAA